MTVKANKKTVVEHIYCNERKGEMVYRVVDAKTRKESQDERVVAVRQNPLRMEFFHRHVSDGYRSYWRAPIKVVATLCTAVSALGAKLEANNEEKVGLGILSGEITGVSYDAVWKSMVKCIREPSKYMQVKLEKLSDNAAAGKLDVPASGGSSGWGMFTPTKTQKFSYTAAPENKGYIQRTVSINGTSTTDNIYVDEASSEIVYRVVNNGVEGDLERVACLRTHPMRIEFHARNTKDGFRVDWTVPKKAALSVVDAYVREAKALDSAKPSIIGYGMTSDPVQDCSFDSLMTAIDKIICEPQTCMDIDIPQTKIRQEQGFLLRRFKLRANGEVIMEKVTINEEAGEAVFNKLTSDGRESQNDRVLSIKQDPLRLEFYERNAADGTRLNWTAPYAVANSTMTKLIGIAKQLEKRDTGRIGYGISSPPCKNLNPDSLWKAMLFCIRNPERCGMPVSNIRIFDNDGYMTRFMTLNATGPSATWPTNKPGNKPTTIDNIYVDERSNEISYRRLELKRGGESLDERIFGIRTQPLRMEMWCRHKKDQLRVDWQAPKAVAMDVFDRVSKMALMMQNDPKGFSAQFAEGMDDSKDGGLNF